MAIYHLAFRSGSRSKGTSASKKSDYIQRQNDYKYQEDKCTYKESDHMPTFAKDEPKDYWQAADTFERKNGRLFVEVEVALPKELNKQEQIQLAHDYAQALTNENKLPYTLAIHQGKGHNPHAHLIISERQNDGIERSAKQWFSRANTLEPDQGGALKSREFHGGQHIKDLRALWAEKANTALEKGGHLERIDHRSLEAQGVERTPSKHIGKASWAMAERGILSSRAKDLEAVVERSKELEREERHAQRQVERELRHHAREAERAQPEHTNERGQPDRSYQPTSDRNQHPNQPGSTKDRGLEPDAGRKSDNQQDKQPQRQYDYGLEL